MTIFHSKIGNLNLKMKKFYDKKINELTIILNKYHKRNYSRNYWEIIIGPFIDRLIFVSRYKWYIVNRNLKQIKHFSKNEIIIEENNFKINTYKEFIFTSGLDELNAYIYSKVFNLLNNNKNKKNYIKLNLNCYKQEIKKNTSIFYFFYKKIFSLVKKIKNIFFMIIIFLKRIILYYV